MTTCYCKQVIPAGARKIAFAMDIDWGTNDDRDASGKHYDFCSFACVAQWAIDRAAAHDGHVIQDATYS